MDRERGRQQHQHAQQQHGLLRGPNINHATKAAQPPVAGREVKAQRAAHSGRRAVRCSAAAEATQDVPEHLKIEYTDERIPVTVRLSRDMCGCNPHRHI